MSAPSPASPPSSPDGRFLRLPTAPSRAPLFPVHILPTNASSSAGESAPASSPDLAPLSPAASARRPTGPLAWLQPPVPRAKPLPPPPRWLASGGPSLSPYTTCIEREVAPLPLAAHAPGPTYYGGVRTPFALLPRADPAAAALAAAAAAAAASTATGSGATTPLSGGTRPAASMGAAAVAVVAATLMMGDRGGRRGGRGVRGPELEEIPLGTQDAVPAGWRVRARLARPRLVAGAAWPPPSVPAKDGVRRVLVPRRVVARMAPGTVGAVCGATYA